MEPNPAFKRRMARRHARWDRTLWIIVILALAYAVLGGMREISMHDDRPPVPAEYQQEFYGR